VIGGRCTHRKDAKYGSDVLMESGRADSTTLKDG